MKTPARRGIEVSRWLVCQEYHWIIHQGSGYGDALLFPSRELAWLMRRSIGQAYIGQEATSFRRR